VRQTIQDLVPKAIMHLLVNFSRESVQNRLVANLYKEGLFDELLHEDEALTAERTRIKNLLQAYKEAFQVRSLDCGAFDDGVSLTCSSELQTLSEVL
jgi:dynamin 1-like protein